VPHCHGWLALDARGEWYMRDERAQRAGPFPAVKGSRVAHEKLREFIHRNYAADERGAWFFQNGPQRVYVQLEAAPYVWRLQDAPGFRLVAHTGQAAGALRQAWLDEHGRLFAHTALGFGLVHTADMALAAGAVEAALLEGARQDSGHSDTGAWVPVELPFAQMPARFGYQLLPQP
jgi:hypothetical protein